MAKAITERYEQMVLEAETAVPGTYAKICGLMDVTISRTANLDESEIPDCDNEALPFEVEVEVRSIVVTVSASGIWAQTSQDMMKAWFYSGATKNIRLRDIAAEVGDIEVEAGSAVLTQLTNSRSKGKRVTAEVEMRFNGVPSRTDKA